MKENFWHNLPKPIMALAPMADVTDPPFRRLIAKYGKPDILWTEFVSCDGLASDGRDRILRDIIFEEKERPIILQVFGSNPENFKFCGKLTRELGFDGVDINMGCPDKSVEKQGAGAALLKTPDLACELIHVLKEAAHPLPVSVKTRIGYSTDELDTWLPKLLSTSPSAITIHARTRREMSRVPANWEAISRAISIRNDLNSDTYILGNGDVTDLNDAQNKVKETGCDGVMLGRAIFGNPWLFNKKMNKKDLSISEILSVLVEHTYLFEELIGDVKNFAVMKKHFKAYVNEFDGAKELRMLLMEQSCAKDVEKVLQNFSKNLPKDNV
tara:strand:- start:2052 stop:3032 length:981 start_codon:yes stop_codon:yes gene_type:complete